MYYYYYNPFDNSFRDGLHLVNAFVDVLVKMHPRMSVATVQTFLYVAGSHGDPDSQGINLTDLAAHFKVPYSSLVRHVEILGEGVPGKPGLGLIARVNVPGQRKEQYVQLADEGIALIARIKTLFAEYSSGVKLSPITRRDLRAEARSVPRRVTRSPRASDEAD